MAAYAEAKSWFAEGGGGIDLFAIPREFPQFGGSIWNTARDREHVFMLDKCDCTQPACSCDRESGPAAETLAPSCEGCSACDSNQATTLGTALHEKICGPDATEFVVSALMSLLTAPLAGQVLGVSGLGKINLRSQVKGCPNKPVAKTKHCPTNCGESITLCQHCVSDQIPGNIALGMVFGRRAARDIGRRDADAHGETDSAEDIESYDVGDSVAATGRAYLGRMFVPTEFGGDEVFVWRRGAAKAIAEKLCKEVKAGVAAGKFEDFSKSQNCSPCPDGAWPGK